MDGQTDVHSEMNSSDNLGKVNAAYAKAYQREVQMIHAVYPQVEAIQLAVHQRSQSSSHMPSLGHYLTG